MSVTLRRIVCDTGPLISLEKITTGYRFIRRVYDRLVVPPAVMKELVVGQFETQDAYLSHFDVADLLVVRDPAGVATASTQYLDEGERQAINLALELDLPLLIEEEAGRRVARELGLQISGIAGQLLKATREGLVAPDDAIKQLNELRQTGRINRQIHDAVETAIEREV